MMPNFHAPAVADIDNLGILVTDPLRLLRGADLVDLSLGDDGSGRRVSRPGLGVDRHRNQNRRCNQNFQCSVELKADVSSVLSKFVIKGGVGLKTINELHLNRGTIGASRHRDEIMEELVSTILESHRISGGIAGYNVRAEAVESVKFYAANNVFTGPIREAFDRLRSRLSLS